MDFVFDLLTMLGFEGKYESKSPYIPFIILGFGFFLLTVLFYQVVFFHFRQNKIQRNFSNWIFLRLFLAIQFLFAFLAYGFDTDSGGLILGGIICLFVTVIGPIVSSHAFHRSQLKEEERAKPITFKGLKRYRACVIFGTIGFIMADEMSWAWALAGVTVGYFFPNLGAKRKL